jgi:hypothetical protein
MFGQRKGLSAVLCSFFLLFFLFLFNSGCGMVWGGVNWNAIGTCIEELFTIPQYGVGGANQANGYGLVEDSMGNLYVSGYTDGGSLPGATQYGTASTGNSIFLSKFSSAGVLDWASDLAGGGASNTTGYGLIQDSSGNLYVAGGTTASLTGSTQYGTYSTGNNLLLTQFNSSGVPQWTSEFGAGGATSALGLALTEDPSGNFYVAGETINTTLPGAIQYGTHSTVSDLLVVKYNSSGVPQWTNQYGAGGATISQVHAITHDQEGNIYITGNARGTLPGDTQYGTQGITNLVVSQLNPSTGAPNWTYQYGGGAGTAQTGYAITQDLNGNIYIAGYTTGTILGETQYGTHGTDDMVLISINASTGAPNWISQYGAGAGSHTQIFGISRDSSGNLYLSGGGDTAFPGATQYGTPAGGSIVVSQFNSLGAPQWTSQFFSATGNIGVNGAFQDPCGNIFPFGATGDSLGGTQYGTHGSLDFFFTKFSSSGVM